MNQILVTKKLYITPELKRKKKIYKFDFILSIFLVIVLISVYIYAEYDRNKSEEVSQDILGEMYTDENKIQKEDTTVAKDDSVLLIVLDDIEDKSTEEYKEDNEPVKESQQTSQSTSQSNSGSSTVSTYRKSVKTTKDGYKYVSVGTIEIPKINVKYPILEGQTGSTKETDSLLKISPCKFWGPNINEVGNYCIVGHNWRNTKFFSKVPTLSAGDTFTIKDVNNRTIKYKIYDKYTVDPSNVSCTSQLTGGRKEVTLITCTNNSEKRVIVKAREVL